MRVRAAGEAFTLIELLAVIAIISVLAALIFPAVGNAMRMASGASCSSNLRQIMVSLNLYLEDNKDVYPFNQPALALMPAYLAGPQVLACPGNRVSKSHNGYPVTQGVQSGYNWSYRMFYRPGGVDLDKSPVKTGLLRYPTIDPLVADADWVELSAAPYWWISSYIHKCWLEPGAPYAQDIWNAKRHPAGVNTLFADGHVTPVTAQYYTDNIWRKGDVHPVTGYHLTE
jgi:prepilin-type N-terminal cleavage/methylation domain-containing protein/prepilin-type processing-associated H-X9-DG protein